MTSFFRDLFGFNEMDVEYEERLAKLMDMAQLTIREDIFGKSKAQVAEHCAFRLPSGRVIDAGFFTTPSVKELRDEVEKQLSARKEHGTRPHARDNISPGHVIAVSNLVGESRSLHHDCKYRGAVVQAASQFNYLEFSHPSRVPEDGIQIYAYDHTQGPACAVACAAGTVYRNYFTIFPEDDSRGQRSFRQLNGLDDIAAELGETDAFFHVKGGYVDSTESKLNALHQRLQNDNGIGEHLASLLRIGVQRKTEATDSDAGTILVQQGNGGCGVRVRDPSLPEDSKMLFTQTYNAAISFSYTDIPPELWRPLAQIVLNGTYEATLLVAVLEALNSASTTTTEPLTSPFPVLLTKVGGGVFGNEKEWIQDAIRRACQKVAKYGVPLRVHIVHYREVEEGYESFNTTF